MKTYRLYLLDVWGNENDGYDVNDKFKTDFKVTVGNDFCDAELIESLKNIYFDPSIDPFDKDIEVNDIGDDSVLYIDYKGKPQIELRLED
jgi:hypothetical protein